MNMKIVEKNIGVKYYAPSRKGGLNYFGKGEKNNSLLLKIKLSKEEENWAEFLKVNTTPAIIGIQKSINSKDNMGNSLKSNDIYECIIGKYELMTEGEEAYIYFIPKSFKKIYTLNNRYVEELMGIDVDLRRGDGNNAKREI